MLLGGFLFLLSSLFLVFNKQNNNDYKGVVELKITTKDMLYEVVYKDEKTYLYENGVSTKVLDSFKRIPNPHLIRPIIDRSYNIVDERDPISHMTWKATIEEGVMFLNYLKSKGYVEIMSVDSPFYLDTILQKGDLKKRVLILNGSLLYGDIEKEPKVQEYIKDHIGGYKK